MSDVAGAAGDEEAGFNTLGDKAGEVKKPVGEVVKEKTAEEIAAEEAAAKKKAEEDEVARKAAEDEEPVVITRAQLRAIMAKLDDGESTKKAVQSLSGTVGNIKTETENLKKVTANTSITPEDFADLIKEFPEIGKGVEKGFGAVLKRLVGVKPAPGVGEDDIKAAIFKVVNDQQLDILEDEFGVSDDGAPVWKKIVGSPGDTNDYRTWLATQPERYQKKLGSTYSASVLAGAIKKFQSHVASEAKKAADLKAAADKAKADGTNGGATDRRRAAVMPRGTGSGEPPPAKGEQTEDEAFESAKRD